MSEAKRFGVRNRLRAAMFDGGGKRVVEALAAADAALCSLAAVCEASVRENLVQIDQTYGPSATGRDQEAPRKLYDLVLQIIDASACDTRSGIPEACSNLRDLLDTCSDRLKIVSGLILLREHRVHVPT